MAVCPVCGCKTDALDFVKSKIGECETDICSFCDKQIKGFSGITQAGPAQARWLSAVLTKEVANRSAELYKELKAIGEKCELPLFNNAEAKPEAQPINPIAKFKAPASVNASADVKDEVIAQLNERITALEKQLRVMKRNMLIKSILEICVPIILGIVILIVFFASGLYDTLAGLYSNFV